MSDNNNEPERTYPCTFCLMEGRDPVGQISSEWTFVTHPSYYGWRHTKLGQITHKHYRPGEPAKSIAKGRIVNKQKREEEAQFAPERVSQSKREKALIDAYKAIKENPQSKEAQQKCEELAMAELARGIVGKDVDRLFLQSYLKITGIMQEEKTPDQFQIYIDPEIGKTFR